MRFLPQLLLRLFLYATTVAVAVAILGTASLGGALIGGALVSALYIAADWFNRPKPETEWHVWDEELEDGLSDTERDMLRKGMVVWPGWCSHGDTYDHEHSVLERSFGRKSEDGAPEEPSVAVFHLDAEEWAAARDQALADIGCTWHDLAAMAAARNFPTSEHGKVWGALGGWTEYERWANAEDEPDVEVTATPKGEYL